METNPMRNLLALVGLAVVLFAGIGWKLGWYTFQTTTTSPGHRQFNVDVDTKKITTDVKQGEQRVEKALHGDGSSATTPQLPDARPVQGQPTSTQGGGISINQDG